MQRSRKWAPRVMVFAAALMSFSTLAEEPAAAPAAPQSTVGQQVPISETTDLRSVLLEIDRIQAEQGNSRILVIFDIDNTVLTMPQALGGDAWFNYHADLVARGSDPDFASMDELFEAQEVLFGLGSMVLTQPDIPGMLDEIHADGVDTFLLSARGPTLYNATRKQLNRNAVALRSPVPCSFLVCDLDGEFTASDVKALLNQMDLLEPEERVRPIVLRDGLMLVAGQNKGKMLHLLLAALGGNRYDHVIFIDDSARNTLAVAGSDLPIALTVFHYTRFEETVSDQELADTHGQWQTVRSALCASIESGICGSAKTDKPESQTE